MGYRSAFGGGVPVDGILHLIASYPRTVEFSGLTVRLHRGSGSAPGDGPVVGALYFPSVPRLLLENLTVSRGKVHKSSGRAAVEERLIGICDARGEDALAALREQSRALAPILGLQREFTVLDALIGGILGTRRSPGHRAFM